MYASFKSDADLWEVHGHDKSCMMKYANNKAQFKARQ